MNKNIYYDKYIKYKKKYCKLKSIKNNNSLNKIYGGMDDHIKSKVTLTNNSDIPLIVTSYTNNPDSTICNEEQETVEIKVNETKTISINGNTQTFCIHVWFQGFLSFTSPRTRLTDIKTVGSLPIMRNKTYGITVNNGSIYRITKVDDLTNKGHFVKVEIFKDDQYVEDDDMRYHRDPVESGDRMKPKEISAADEIRLAEMISNKHFRYTDVLANGSCLFYALCLGNNNEDSNEIANQYRKLAIEYILEKWDNEIDLNSDIHNEGFCPPSDKLIPYTWKILAWQHHSYNEICDNYTKEQYEEYMKDPKSFGGESEILALAKIWGKEIQVYRAGEKIKIDDRIISDKNTTNGIGYFNNTDTEPHYRFNYTSGDSDKIYLYWTGKNERSKHYMHLYHPQEKSFIDQSELTDNMKTLMIMGYNLPQVKDALSNNNNIEYALNILSN